MSLYDTEERRVEEKKKEILYSLSWSTYIPNLARDGYVESTTIASSKQDASSKGCIIQEMHRQRDGMSKNFCLGKQWSGTH